MRIIHVENYFDPTAGYQINELLIASKEFNDKVFLITSNDMSRFHKKVDPQKDLEFEKKTGVKIIRLKKRFKISSRIVLKNLNKKINELDPDIVFMHGIADFRDLKLWRRKSKYKLVRDCHMSWVASKNKFRKIFYFFYRVFFAPIINSTDKYEKVFALGEEEYQYLKKIGINNDKIEFLPHGYNDSIMYYDEKERIEIRDYYEIKKNDILISYIGKFNNSKHPDLILDIITKLDKDFVRNNNIKLLFLGPKDQEYMKFFNNKMNIIKDEYNLNIIVDESKPFKKLRKYFSATDISVFPKETSLSSIHAQVCGCPVIMENHTSNEERVIEPHNLYPVDNITKASKILKRIISNKEYIKHNNLKKIKKIEHREYKNQIEKVRNIVSQRQMD